MIIQTAIACLVNERIKNKKIFNLFSFITPHSVDPDEQGGKKVMLVSFRNTNKWKKKTHLQLENKLSENRECRSVKIQIISVAHFIFILMKKKNKPSMSYHFDDRILS